MTQFKIIRNLEFILKSCGTENPKAPILSSTFGYLNVLEILQKVYRIDQSYSQYQNDKHKVVRMLKNLQNLFQHHLQDQLNQTPLATSISGT